MNLRTMVCFLVDRFFSPSKILFYSNYYFYVFPSFFLNSKSNFPSVIIQFALPCVRLCPLPLILILEMFGILWLFLRSPSACWWICRNLSERERHADRGFEKPRSPSPFLHPLWYHSQPHLGRTGPALWSPSHKVQRMKRHVMVSGCQFTAAAYILSLYFWKETIPVWPKHYKILTSLVA